LKAGNQRFLSGQSIQSTQSSLAKLKEYARKQQLPKAIVLCCSDSRAPVEMIFDQGLGDLFVIRVAGNIIAPSLIGSIEYAVSAFPTHVVVVMGHTQCGAVTATLNYIERMEAISSENIHDIISRIKPHIFPLTQIPGMSYEEKLNQAILANVRASVGQLCSSSRLIEQLVLEEKLTIAGSVFDLSTGNVHFLET
jgi:carbonic anhydrase